MRTSVYDEERTRVSAEVLFYNTVSGPTGPITLSFEPRDYLEDCVATVTICNGMGEGATSVQCPVCSPPTGSGDPVSYIDGNMRYSDTDPLPRQMEAIALTRTYDSHQRFRRSFGSGWWSMFDARLAVDASVIGEKISFTTENHEAVVFSSLNGTFTQLWPSGRSTPGTLRLEGGSLYVYRREGSATASLH